CMLLGCASALAAPPMGLQPGAAAGFAQADAPHPFQFPRDDAPHPAFRHEWWYVTGNLDAADGTRCGFELTFFRFALEPPPAAPPSAPRSAWRSREVWMAH